MVRRTPDSVALAESIDAREVLRLSQELIRIPSVFHHEEKVAKFIHDRLEKWGFEPRNVPVKDFGPDVVCEIGPANAPCMVFNGHMDTVEVMEGWKHDPFGAKVEKGMLYGLGALDMKCGIASMMLAFRVLAESDAVRKIRFMFQAVTGEEDTGYGTWELVKSGAFRGAKAAIVGEGFGGLKAITIGRRGSSYFDINIHGKAAHGAKPEEGISAIADASRVVAALETMPMRSSRTMTGDDFNPLKESQTVLKIRGGSDSLSVPEQCYIYVVSYTLPGSKNTKERDLGKAIGSLTLKSRVDLKLKSGIHLYHPYHTSSDSALVNSAVDAVRKETGASPRLILGLSEADDNVIAHEIGIPVICFGPGELGTLARYHQPEEAVSVSQLAPAARAYVSTALSLAGRLAP
jgi:acetylornithine deacetylase/succinyl-diaminopimelate desuccinylase family protein